MAAASSKAEETMKGGGDLRKEFQRIQENNKSAFENEKPLHLKRVNQPPPLGMHSRGGESGGLRVRPHESCGGSAHYPNSAKFANNQPRTSARIKICLVG